MVAKDKITSMALAEDTLSAINMLVEITKTNRSMVIREIVPPVPVIEAMHELAQLHGNTGRNVARDIATACVWSMYRVMREDVTHGIREQVEIQCYPENCDAKIPILFTCWARAKRGIEGYRFEKTNEKNFNIVVGPEFSGAQIVLLKKRVDNYK